MRPIDADAFKARIQKGLEEAEKGSENNPAFNLSKQVVNSFISTIDLEPTLNLRMEPKRKAGHWIYEEYQDGFYTSTCSECGAEITTINKIHSPYCSECGAAMSDPPEDITGKEQTGTEAGR